MTAPHNRALSIVKIGLFMIANAMMAHESLVASGALKNVQPLTRIDRRDPQGWLKREWQAILDTDYRSVFEPALNLLISLPSHPTLRELLLELSDVARKAVSNRAILKHDLAGRLYHTLLLREVAKGLATYYTSIPAATMLAILALDQLWIDWSNIDEIKRIRVVDLACGSGTLLSAVYSEIVDRYVMSVSSRPDISSLHKDLLEKVLYGFDVLEYAAHLTATALTLRHPSQFISDVQVFTVPLGVVGGVAYLGSLDMTLNGSYVVFPVVRRLTGGLTAQVTRETVDVRETGKLKIDRPDLIIMNPPFARTGNVGKSTLFGHLPEADRKEVLDKLKRLGEKLIKAHGLYEGFGRAGLAAYFLLKAYEISKDNAVLALVLPRVFLSGSDWKSVRGFMFRRGSFKYIIVSDDPSVSWAWSENTVLSEILVIYQKGRNTEDVDLTVAYVRRRPRSALEAKTYANMLKLATSELRVNPGDYVSPTRRITMNRDDIDDIMYVYKVKASALARVVDVNMNILVGFHSSFLSDIAYRLFTERMFADFSLPLIPLKDYLRRVCTSRDWEECVGYDVAQVRRKCIDRGNNPVWFLDSLNMQTFSSLRLPRGVLKTVYTTDECISRAGRLLIAGVARLWLPTIGVIATYHDQPVLSQVAWTIPLPDDEAKIQTLWLNTTPGLLHFLSMRQDSKGGFVQLKKKTLGELLLIDTSKLNGETRKELLNLFNAYASENMSNIYTQLRQATNRKGTRYDLDTRFLQTLGINTDKLKERLEWIYRELLDETLLYAGKDLQS